MEFPALWFMKDDPYVSYDLGEALIQDASLGVINTHDLAMSHHDLAVATGDSDSFWPAEFPLPVVALPDWPFAPDFWSFGRYDFASCRLRNTLAQPPNVIQFLPLDLVRASVAAQAQDYRWMRVLPRQPAMDIARSDCEVADYIDQLTGKLGKYLRRIDRFALLDGFVPHTGIFRLDESPAFILTTDALAGRVLRAGCTGIEFSDPANLRGGKRVHRIRTAHGIAERRIGFLD
jgi:hypothetical protein